MNTTQPIDLKPLPLCGSHKQGELHGATYDDLVAVLGLPNYSDDPCKVRWSWAFTANNSHHIAIWDWKGSADHKCWSVYGPLDIWQSLFPNKLVVSLYR